MQRLHGISLVAYTHLALHANKHWKEPQARLAPMTRSDEHTGDFCLLSR